MGVEEEEEEEEEEENVVKSRNPWKSIPDWNLAGIAAIA